MSFSPGFATDCSKFPFWFSQIYEFTNCDQNDGRTTSEEKTRFSVAANGREKETA